MSTVADFYFHRAMPVLRRNPVRTAMLVYSLGFCVAASIAAFAAWRESSEHPILQRPAHSYLVQSALPVPRGTLPDAGLNRSRSRDGGDGDGGDGGGFDQVSSDG